MIASLPFAVEDTFRSLRSRNFRLFMASQIISMTGIWVQRMSMGWLVYSLTDSPFLLSLNDFASQIPILLFGLFTGAIVDRTDKRRLIQRTQFLLMLLALTLAFLTLSSRASFTFIFFVSICLGCTNALDMPARQACISQMVDRPDYLTNAIALNSAVFNLSRVIGPTVAGFVVAAIGEGYCFLLTGLAFCAPIYALSVMKLRTASSSASEKRPGMLSSIREGISYVGQNRHLSTILLFVCCTSFLGLPIYVMFPVLVRKVLEGDARLFGYLLGGIGIGALCGTIKIAAASGIQGMPRRLFYSLLTFGTALTTMGLVQNRLLIITLSVFVGWGLIHSTTACNTMIQTFISDTMRGRVMGLYSIAVSGIAPIGSILAGSLMHHFGVVPTILVHGGACIMTALMFRYFIPILDNRIYILYEECCGESDFAERREKATA